MKVYIGYQCYYDYCNVWETAVKVFDDAVKALVWKEEFVSTDTEWRNFVEFKVE